MSKVHQATMALAAALACAPGVPAAPADGTAAEALHVVVLGDRRPLVVKLQIRVDGKPHTEAWNAYITGLFRHFDRDGDGGLTETEARRAPSASPLRRQLDGDLYTPLAGSRARFADLDPGHKGKIHLADFLAYYRREGVGPVWVAPGDPPGNLSALSEALFRHLDTNHNGKLSKTESAAASRLIPRLDANDDGYLSPDELLADRPRSAQPAREVAAEVQQGFVVVGDDPSERRAALAKRLLARYGTRDRAFVLPAEIGLSQASFERLDANHDGRLDAAELVRVDSLSPDAELEIDFAEGRSRISHKGSGQSSGVRAVHGLMVAGTRIDAECLERRINSSGIRSLYQQQFRTADRDRQGFVENKHVDSPALRQLQVLFPLADRDEDGRLTEKELNDFLDLHARGLGAFVSVAVTGRRSTMFEMLDADADGRLGYADLRLAGSRLTPFFRDGTGGLSADDLPQQLGLVFTRGALGPKTQRQNTGTDIRPVAPTRTIPAWFANMDRDGDGFISPREFLGPPEAFRRLDADGDSLISAEEARKADGSLKP